MSTDDRILAAAMRVFEEVGLRAATTRRIAEEAGVNEVTLFRRFGSKEQLLTEAMRRRQASAPRLLPEAPRDAEAELRHWLCVHAAQLAQVRLLIRSSLTEIDAHPKLCARAHEGPRRIATELSAYLERLAAAGLCDPLPDPAGAATMLMGAVFSEVVARPMLPDGEAPPRPEQIADRYLPLFLRAIGASGGRA
ncbi:MAG: TetR/AcrR family transcriptional regulator [Myxococcota bacterium]